MSKGGDVGVLRDVSRSFYLSLRVLPAPMRAPVSVAYLLARSSDTLADTAEAAAEARLAWLDGFVAEVKGEGSDWRSGIRGFVETQTHPGEKALMSRLDDVFAAYASLAPAERHLVRGVFEIITSGQRLDVERFEVGSGRLTKEAELEDYCHRVAGCVGVFWTRIGFETLGNRFSKSAPEELGEIGERFGRGLQLVNILRDLPKDLRNGRCYLPVEDPTDRTTVLAEAARWRAVARERMRDGLDYARSMAGRRLTMSVALPALIGVRTLDLLDAADWETLERGVKVSRAEIRRCLWRAAWI
ncbi:farnesyl-diphosphate farnesyltransferase [Haloferula helveola]|uniref:Farnesyl-diphosphate farnesyltransferase n=1 Tax=Haloferula helveola TaxID=490095 RepID=A0ABN6HB18_9BACT|nr:farnesyl-diphosphate farnesyltransferase [Haloferula helveola]